VVFTAVLRILQTDEDLILGNDDNSDTVGTASETKAAATSSVLTTTYVVDIIFIYYRSSLGIVPISLYIVN